MVKDYVRWTKERGVEEEQIVHIEFFDEDNVQAPDLKVLKMQLGKAVKAEDQAKIDEIEAKIQEAGEALNTGLDMSYEDFSTFLEKEEVRITGKAERDGARFYEFTWNDEDYTLGEAFIN